MKMKMEVDDEGKEVDLNSNSGVLLLFVISLHSCVDCYTYSAVVIANDLLNQLRHLCNLLPYVRISPEFVHSASHQRQRLT